MPSCQIICVYVRRRWFGSAPEHRHVGHQVQFLVGEQAVARRPGHHAGKFKLVPPLHVYHSMPFRPLKSFQGVARLPSRRVTLSSTAGGWSGLMLRVTTSTNAEGFDHGSRRELGKGYKRRQNRALGKGGGVHWEKAEA